MNYTTRPLTKKMLAHLMAARAIELSATGRNICVPDDFKGSLSGLYSRGLVKTKMVIIDGKETLGVFITSSGIDLLKHIQWIKN